MHVELTTERMLLRRFTPDDVDELVALDGDPAVMRYLTGGRPTPRALIESRMLPGFMASYAPVAGFGVWAALERATGRFLGWFSLRPAEEGNAREATLGYRLRQDAWGQGFATEGARALIRRAFAELGVARVTASTYEDNRASRRVMERVGMTFARAFRLTADDLAAHATFAGATLEVWDGDEVEYALTREQWALEILCNRWYT
jgi:RimJ/RimL family protein N-acetyltransferase